MGIAAERLQDILGYRFRQTDLLRLALTHRSQAPEHNERLEFLGDSVLNCIMTQSLFLRFPEEDEGKLSRMRANLVNRDALHAVALRLDLGKYLLLGEGELKSGGTTRPSILADTLEALIGAVFSDGGFDAAQSVVVHCFSPELSAITPHARIKDAKSRLQEYLQGRGLALPIYEVLATTGKSHAQNFRVRCQVAGLNLETDGQGKSRRAAEQDAAEKACLQLISI